MNILAINPKDFYTGWPVQSDFGREFYRGPAVTFPILSRLLPKGLSMRFIDGFYEPIKMRDYMAAIREADIVLVKIEASCGSLSYAVAIEQIQRINPGALIIAGGHHANMFRERWLRLGIDVIVKSEAERIFTDLIVEAEGKRQWDKIPGLAFLADGKYVETEDVALLTNLDESPIPDWDLWNLPLYTIRTNPTKGLSAAVETSRGCMFNCNFCAVPVYWRHTQRYKTVGRVMEEIDQLRARGVTMLNFLDDGFGNNPDFTNELVEALGRHRGRLVWQSFMRVDTLLADPSLVDRAARNGWVTALFGFESLNQKTLTQCFSKGMRSRPTLQEYQELYARMKRNKVFVIGTFISGHPGMADSMRTSYFDARTVCDDPRLADYMPNPGTAGYAELAEKYHIKDMFFHDAKLPIFPEQGVEALKFNILNTLDIPRMARMMVAGHVHRNFVFLTFYYLISKLLRVNKRKFEDFKLLHRKDLSADERQKRLMARYLEDPEYKTWLDGQSERVWM